MFSTRTAEPGDAALITRHRRAMFEAMGSGTPDVLDEMTRNFHPWITAQLAAGRYLGWIAACDGQTAGSAGMFVMEFPPGPHCPGQTYRGHLLNVYVEPKHRRQGLARQLVEACLAEARRRNIRLLSLHASDEGRPLYESLGFRATNEMQLLLADGE